MSSFPLLGKGLGQKTRGRGRSTSPSAHKEEACRLIQRLTSCLGLALLRLAQRTAFPAWMLCLALFIGGATQLDVRVHALLHPRVVSHQRCCLSLTTDKVRLYALMTPAECVIQTPCLLSLRRGVTSPACLAEHGTDSTQRRPTRMHRKKVTDSGVSYSGLIYGTDPRPILACRIVLLRWLGSAAVARHSASHLAVVLLLFWCGSVRAHIQHLFPAIIWCLALCPRCLSWPDVAALFNIRRLIPQKAKRAIISLNDGHQLANVGITLIFPFIRQVSTGWQGISTNTLIVGAATVKSARRRGSSCNGKLASSRSSSRLLATLCALAEPICALQAARPLWKFGAENPGWHTMTARRPCRLGQVEHREKRPEGGSKEANGALYVRHTLSPAAYEGPR